MRTLAARLHGIRPTIFAEVSALAARTGAINLAQGFPDEDGPLAVVEQARRALAAGENQYAPGRGRPELLAAISGHQQDRYGLAYDPANQIVVTTGATEAIAAAILALVDPGDEVVVVEPYYDSYAATIQMAGGIRRPVTLRWPDFRLDLVAMRAAVTDRTVMILLNSPHNPTGSVLTDEELAGIAAIAHDHDLVVVSDEVYEHLTYDGLAHRPIATLPGMADRTLTISSVGKSWSFTGWKIGWVCGPPTLVSAVLSAKQWLSFCSTSSVQSAVALALTEHVDWTAALRDSLQDRRDVLSAGLSEIGIPTNTPQGTYFALSDISELGWPDAKTFCERLPHLACVAALPVQVFYDHPDAGRQLVRWAFCKETAVLVTALERLGDADLRCRD